MKGILIIDDEKALLTLVQTMVEALDYRSYTATNSARAFEILGQFSEHIHLVILDVFLGGEDGKAVLGQIKARYPHLPVVLSTGYAEPDFHADLTNLDCPAVLTKPYRKEDLKELLTGILGR